MTRRLAQPIPQPERRWHGDKSRPGVEACAQAGRGGWNRESGAKYAVVTSRKRTEHDTFEEAAEEYRMRRAGVGA